MAITFPNKSIGDYENHFCLFYMSNINQSSPLPSAAPKSLTYSKYNIYFETILF